jgi:hypothetical protein
VDLRVRRHRPAPPLPRGAHGELNLRPFLKASKASDVDRRVKVPPPRPLAPGREAGREGGAFVRRASFASPSAQPRERRARAQYDAPRTRWRRCQNPRIARRLRAGLGALPARARKAVLHTNFCITPRTGPRPSPTRRVDASRGRPPPPIQERAA